MKTLLTILIAALATTSYSKDPDDISSPGRLNGCLGMKWGATIEQAKGVIGNRGDMTLNNESTGDLVRLEYGGGMLTGIPVNYLILSFYKGEFFESYVQFTDGSTSEFAGVMGALNKKYGTCNSHSIDSASWRMMGGTISLQSAKNDQTGGYGLSLNYVNSSMLQKIPFSARQKKPEVNGKGL